MLVVANLSHFFSCRKVHILGSFQNIKMARTAICNLILGESSLFLWCFLWEEKNRKSKNSNQICKSVEGDVKDSKEKRLGVGTRGPKRKKQASFYLDSICLSAREQKGFIDLCCLNLCCLLLMRCTEKPFQNNSSTTMFQVQQKGSC